MRLPRLRTPLALASTTLLAAPLLALTGPTGPATAAAVAPAHSLRQHTTDADLRAGTAEGTRVVSGSLVIARPAGRLTYARKRWDWARWTSPWVTPAHGFTQVIPSWNAVTGPGTWVQVGVRGRTSTGRLTGWKVLGRWATHDAAFRRTTAGRQADALASISVDTLVAAAGVRLRGYQLNVTLLRRAGTAAGPTLRSVQAVATLPGSGTRATSRPLLGARTLAVPSYSQMTHRGHSPQYGGGGQAWCSPTSLSMLLGYYRALPAATIYRGVPAGPDRFVDHIARVVYDHGYRGAGNWAFNTAYAANLTADAFVTRLGDLTQAERLIAAGIPLAASISFSRGQLRGSPLTSTSGHLVVIVGFAGAGDVVVNDPAAPSNAGVRRVYDRGQFERAWQGRSLGTTYVVRDARHPLPARGALRGW